MRFNLIRRLLLIPDIRLKHGSHRRWNATLFTGLSLSVFKSIGAAIAPVPELVVLGPLAFCSLKFCVRYFLTATAVDLLFALARFALALLRHGLLLHQPRVGPNIVLVRESHRKLTVDAVHLICLRLRGRIVPHSKIQHDIREPWRKRWTASRRLHPQLLPATQFLAVPVPKDLLLFGPCECILRYGRLGLDLIIKFLWGSSW